MDLTIGGSVAGSTLKTGHSEITLSVAGSVTGSHILGEVTGTIEGNVTGSRFIAGESSDITLDINGNMTNTRIETDNEISVDVAGKVSGSELDCQHGRRHAHRGQ